MSKARAARAADILVARARDKGVAVLVAHGYFNWMIGRELARRGIMIRSFPNPQLRDCIRISIGTTAEHEVLLRELTDILQNGIPE